MYITIAVLAIALAMHAVIFLTKRKHPSAAIHEAIEKAILELQNTAIDNVITEESKGFDPNLMAKLTVTVKKTLKLIYTVQQHEKGFLHTVSSQLKRTKGENYHIECMLIMMLILQNELELIGINPDDVKLQFDQSELGTLYIEMLLTPGEHNRFSRKVKELLQKDPTQTLRQLTQPHDSAAQTSKKKNIQTHTWKEPECETINKAFTIENLRYLLEDGAKESNAEFTHQQIADWCRRWNCEIYSDRVDVPTEIGELIFDVDAQWDMNLFNTYSIEELNELDFSQIQLPTEWFQKWAAELKNFTEQPVIVANKNMLIITPMNFITSLFMPHLLILAFRAVTKVVPVYDYTDFPAYGGDYTDKNGTKLVTAQKKRGF